MFHSYTIVFAKVINVFIKKLFSIVAYCFLGRETIPWKPQSIESNSPLNVNTVLYKVWVSKPLDYTSRMFSCQWWWWNGLFGSGCFLFCLSLVSLCHCYWQVVIFLLLPFARGFSEGIDGTSSVSFLSDKFSGHLTGICTWGCCWWSSMNLVRYLLTLNQMGFSEGIGGTSSVSFLFGKFTGHLTGCTWGCCCGTVA